VQGYAVVFADRMTAAYRPVDLPEPGPDDVVIDVDVSWISNGTESSYFRGERIAGDTPYEEGMPWPFPIVAGYQKTGTVVSVGSQVTTVRPGDRVFATVSRIAGMFEPLGGHVNPAVTPSGEVWKLPEGRPSEDYAGLVLTQVGYNCGMRAPVLPGDRAVVIGDGLVANWTAQTLLHRGAKVMALGRHDERLAAFPADAVRCNTREREAAAAVRAFAPQGVSAVVDTVGDNDAMYRLLPQMKRDSHLVSAGFYGSRGLIDIQRLRDMEITLHAPSGWTRERMDATLQGVSGGWLKTGSLATHRFPAERAADAWRLITDKTEPFLGILLDWR